MNDKTKLLYSVNGQDNRSPLGEKGGNGWKRLKGNQCINNVLVLHQVVVT